MTKQERLRQILKSDDQLLPKLFVRPLANRIVGLIGETKITPTQVTIFSFIISIMAALFILYPSYKSLFIGALLVQVSWVFDSVDGQLARYKNLSTKFGAWLDDQLDVLKSFLYLMSFSCHFFLLTNSIQFIVWGSICSFLFCFLMLFFEKRKSLVVQKEANSVSMSDLSITSKLFKLFRFGTTGISFYLGLGGFLNYGYTIHIVTFWIAIQYLRSSHNLWKGRYYQLINRE